MVGRRTVLTGTALLGIGGCAPPPAPELPAVPPGPVTIEQRPSEARGRDVEVVRMRPQAKPVTCPSA